MLAGVSAGKDVDLSNIFEAVGKRAADLITDDDLKEIEDITCPTCGSCAGMFTANTMNCMIEALGFALPGNGTIPAVYSARDRLAKEAGRHIMMLVEKNIRPSDILTEKAFLNAVAVDMALGGSTNTALHLPALAHAAGVSLTLDDFEEISRKIPHICSMSPGGSHHIQDLYAAGGVQAVMARLLDGGLIDGSVLTVTGASVKENLAGVTVKDSNGQPLNKEDGIQVSINPVGNTGGFTTLDDPSTECKPEENYKGCEFYIRMGQAPVDVTAGKATVFVHSLNATGHTTLTVTTVDPVSGTTIAAAQDFEIVATSPPLPSQLALVGPSNALYVEQSGGNNSGQLHVEVLDPIGQPVPDPVAGATAFNNYQLEILGTGSPISAKLRGTDASGATVTGTKLKLRTTAGIGGATFIGGSDAASYIVRLSADRADNNVDNGISHPVTVERSVVVSDGRLYDLEITQPTVNALTINPSGNGIAVTTHGDITIPVSPDGTYSVTVGVIATDRMGNPVLPGTEIRFGLIDEPQATGIGDYYIAGGDGNPEEGGKLFTAVNGAFTTAGGGVGPGDTLVIFGEEVIGNREMESARTVTQVNSATSLGVDYRFNLNDTTGNNVDYGGILPYVVGRAADGNIVATAQTNLIGVATTKLNFPVNWLGKRAIIWAQGDRAMEHAGASPRKVTDVEYAFFAGVAPAELVVSPNVLPANSTHEVTVCLHDALGAPLGGIPVGFAFQELIGVGKVDGVTGSGTVADLTAFGSGCATAQVQTSGMLEGDGEPKLVFSAAGATDEVTFSFSPLILMARPSAMISGGTVYLTLLDANGNPQPGFQLRGSCESSGGATIGIASGPGITNSAGKTTALIDAIDLNQIGGAGSGKCTFETADGSAQAVVTLQGRDLCTLGTSPPIPGCPEDEVDQATLTVEIAVLAGAPSGSYTVTTAPGGGACTNTTSGSALTVTCTIDFDEGTPVVLNTTGPAGAVFNGWAGTCAPSVPQQATVQMDGARSCRATWGP